VGLIVWATAGGVLDEGDSEEPPRRAQGFRGRDGRVSDGFSPAWKRQRIGHGIAVKPGERQ
jgi:hypothetical protein